MARPTTEHYDLSKPEKRHLIKLIEQGGRCRKLPLPTLFQFMRQTTDPDA